MKLRSQRFEKFEKVRRKKLFAGGCPLNNDHDDRMDVDDDALFAAQGLASSSAKVRSESAGALRAMLLGAAALGALEEEVQPTAKEEWTPAQRNVVALLTPKSAAPAATVAAVKPVRGLAMVVADKASATVAARVDAEHSVTWLVASCPRAEWTRTMVDVLVPALVEACCGEGGDAGAENPLTPNAAELLALLVSGDFAPAVRPALTGKLAALVPQLRQTGAPRLLLALLRIVEGACLESKENAVELGNASAAALAFAVLYTTDETTPLGSAALKALVNVTNECAEGVRGLLATDASIALSLMQRSRERLSRVWAARNDHSRSREEADADFDACLLLLCVLANVAEDDGVGLPTLSRVAFADGTDPCAFLVSAFVQSLPVAASSRLTSGDTHSTIEFGWTPEELVLSAHVSLVVGCLVRDASAKDRITRALPGQRGFSPFIQVVDAFLEFQREAGVLTRENAQAVARVAGFLRQATAQMMLPPALPGPGLGLGVPKRAKPSSSSS